MSVTLCQWQWHCQCECVCVPFSFAYSIAWLPTSTLADIVIDLNPLRCTSYVQACMIVLEWGCHGGMLIDWDPEITWWRVAWFYWSHRPLFAGPALYLLTCSCNKGPFNADGGGGCPIFREKALRRCKVQCYLCYEAMGAGPISQKALRNTWLAPNGTINLRLCMIFSRADKLLMMVAMHIYHCSIQINTNWC